jgi:class 3 adenylate cyclase
MPELTAGKRSRLPDSAFAYIDSKGTRRLPINDEAHVRNALSRFEQVTYDDVAAKERARNRLLVAAKRYGIVPIGFISGQLRLQQDENEELRTRIRAGSTTKRRLPAGKVTLLLTDIEGSTQILRRLGDGYGVVLEEHRDIIRTAVREAGGHEVDARADEYFAVFERAISALEAAISVQTTLATHAWPLGLTLRVRVGIHTGSPLFSKNDYVGLPVHTAARICAAGHGGQVLLSGAAYKALNDAWPDGVSARSLGAFALAGLPKPETLYQVVASDLMADFPQPRISITPPPSEHE